MENSNNDSNKKMSKDKFRVNYIFNENGLTFMNCIEKNFKRYIENLK